MAADEYFNENFGPYKSVTQLNRALQDAGTRSDIRNDLQGVGPTLTPDEIGTVSVSNETNLRNANPRANGAKLSIPKRKKHFKSIVAELDVFIYIKLCLETI